MKRHWGFVSRIGRQRLPHRRPRPSGACAPPSRPRARPTDRRHRRNASISAKAQSSRSTNTPTPAPSGRRARGRWTSRTTAALPSTAQRPTGEGRGLACVGLGDHAVLDVKACARACGPCSGARSRAALTAALRRDMSAVGNSACVMSAHRRTPCSTSHKPASSTAAPSAPSA